MLISLDELAVPFVGVLAPAPDEGLEGSGPGVRQRTVQPLMAHPSAAPEGYLVGAGAAFDERRAELAARCEALERLSQCDVPSDLPIGTAEEIAAAVDPQAFVLFSDRQYRSEAFPYVPFTTTTRVRWVEGWDLARRCPAMVPAQLVFPRLPDAAAESPIAYISSTGCAAGPDLASATLSALLEAVERDALMCTWKLGVSPSLLDPADLPAAARVAHAVVSDGGELDVRIADLGLRASRPLPRCTSGGATTTSRSPWALRATRRSDGRRSARSPNWPRSEARC